VARLAPCVDYVDIVQREIILVDTKGSRLLVSASGGSVQAHTNGDLVRCIASIIVCIAVNLSCDMLSPGTITNVMKTITYSERGIVLNKYLLIVRSRVHEDA
jgi:hypothetical protein